MTRPLGLLILLALASLAIAQESPLPPAEQDTPASVESGAPATAEDDADPADSDPELFDDPDLDEQTYEEDDDVFVPTEEIPSDEPIPFPTNI